MKPIFSKTTLRFGNRIVAVTVCLGALSAPALAQGAFDMGMLTNTLSMDAITQTEGARAKKHRKARTKRTPVAKPVSTAYRSEPEVTTRVKAQYVNYIATQAPEARQAVAADMKRFNPVKIWTGLVAEDGLHPNDVADALSSYYVLNWAIANKKTSVSRPSIQSVRRQFKAVLGANPTFIRLSNAKKQEMAEFAMLNFLYQQKMYTEALGKKDNSLLQKLGSAASLRFRQDMKLDPHRLKIGSAGFQVL